MGANGSGGRAADRRGVTPEVSFEFYPPRTAKGRRALVATAQRLAVFAPAYYSVTYGAGGSTRDRTFAAAKALLDAGLDAAPHLSWGGVTGAEVLALVAAYRALGVGRIVALRGDTPSGVGPDAGARHADALVRLLRRRAQGGLKVYVAAYPETHPQAASASADIDYLKRKVDAGADACITQYFYNAPAYLHFRDRCAAAGIGVPIVAGVMPITNRANLMRFSDKAGVDVPRWIRMRLAELDGDDAALADFGADVVTGLCRQLLAEGAPGLHFYTLNDSAPTAAVAKRLDAFG